VVLLLAAVTAAMTISLVAFGPLVGLLDGVTITRLLAAGVTCTDLSASSTELRPGPAPATDRRRR
jgi:hypothetical protein